MIYFNSTDHLCPDPGSIDTRASSSDLTDHDLPCSNGEDEDNFGDDECTDGKDSNGRSSSENKK